MIAGNHRRSVSISKAFLLAAVAIALSSRLDADVTYDYTGNLLTPGIFNSLFIGNVCGSPECFIQGGFNVAHALDANLNMVTISPPSFSFQFGFGTPVHQEFDQSNTSCFFMGVQVCTQSFAISTDANGDISQWQIVLADSFSADRFDITGSGDGVSELSSELTWGNSAPGTWTSTVPEPSAVILLATICCAFFLARRRWRSITPPQTPKT
jgi:hypothetical protein